MSVVNAPVSEEEPPRGYHLLFTDGNKNPGGSPMIGGVLLHRKNGKLRVAPGSEFSRRVEGDSIDVWEYTALIEGLKLANERKVRYLSAYMDRHSIVEQVVKRAKVRGDLKPFYEEVLRLTDGMIYFRLSWIPRELNKRADEIARHP